MPKITSFDRGARDAMHNAMLKAMKEISERFDVEISADGYRYDGSGKYFEPKFRVAVRDAEGEAYDPAEEDFKRYCGNYGLEESDIGKTFKVQGALYRITGLKPSRPKYPISAERVRDDRVFKFPAGAVKRALARAAT